jgi:hypothetical protein
MKMAVFRALAPCRLVEVYRHFVTVVLVVTLMMEAGSRSEMLENFY